MLILHLAMGTDMASAQQIHQTLDVPAPEIPSLPEPDRDTLTICILGDVMMHDAQISNALRKDGTYDFSTYFQFIKDDIAEADIAIANMEFTLAGTPYTGYPNFSAPDSYATYLKECGFDIFLTANNHIYDKGKEGAERTIQIYKDLDITYAGLAADGQELADNTPLILNKKGISIAIINMTYGTNTGIGSKWPYVNRLSHTSALEEAMKEAETCDFTIALPHWGNEYELTHSPYQEETAKWLIANGADIIVGAHPHVVQDMQEISNTYVIYSLGNAISNMSAANTQIELMAKIRVVREGMIIKKILQPEFTYLWCSRPGGYCSSYTVLPVTEFIGTRDTWQGAWEYDKMVTTYERVKSTTGIEE